MRRFGELEAVIMDRLWERGRPALVREIVDDLHEDRAPAYTTVMTTLSRLHAKQALVRTARGRAFPYALVGDESEARASVTAHHMSRLLDGGLDRASVLTHFVENLDDESEQLLRELLGRERPAP